MKRNQIKTKTKAVSSKSSQKVKRRRKRDGGNDFVSNERRQQLVELIGKTASIREAARILQINNSTAKSIFYKYKKTG
jgi:molybdenum-dependent DNA-binding transcriptional regulator ModE